jgi:thiosulfate dehydrogenase (quinone) large subunit
MKTTSTLNKVIALLRISLGFIFLWVFLDKTFGLGFSTQPSRAWIEGNSPTAGFLTNSTGGPFAEFFASMAGSTPVDLLFMMGMLGVGLALMFGIGMFIATLAGSAQMLLIYFADFPPKNNPLIDQHIIYILVLWLLYGIKAGDVYGYGRWWKNTALVKKYWWLG